MEMKCRYIAFITLYKHYLFNRTGVQLKSTHILKCFLITRGLFLASLGFFIVSGCSSYDHPDLTIRQVGWQPDRDLRPYLDTDSMIQSLAQLKGTRQRLDSLLAWTDLLKYHDAEAALHYANEVSDLATKNKVRFSQALGTYYQALLKGRRGILGESIEDALADIKISHQLLQDSDNLAWSVRIKGLLGYYYYKHRRADSTFLDSARYYVNQALDLSASLKLPEPEVSYLRGQLFQDLANTHQKDSVKAVELYFKSIEEFEVSGNLASLASIWRIVGNFYIDRQASMVDAETAYQKSLDYALRSSDTINIVSSYQRLGDLKSRQFLERGDERDYRKSMQYLRACLPIQKDNLYYTYALMAWNFYDKFLTSNDVNLSSSGKILRPDEENAQRYLPEADSAIIYYQLVLDETLKEGVFNMMSAAVTDILDLCDIKKELTGIDCTSLFVGEKNYKHFLNNTYKSLVDTVRTEVIVANQRLRIAQKLQQEAANQRRVLRNWGISGSGLGLAIILFLILLQIQQRKRFQARMETLRAQINPHFMSNSLNAIENLVNRGQREAASKYLIHFSRLTRKILNSSRNAMTSLKEEVQTLKHFLALEQLRFRDKLTYVIEIDPELQTDKIEVPALILQPYIENSILHGIKPKTGPGKVWIKVYRQKNKLVCEVEDDGVGREKSRKIQENTVLQQGRQSHGMKINDERLQMIGKTKGAKVEIVDLKNAVGEATGTRVIISFPFKLRSN